MNKRIGGTLLIVLLFALISFIGYRSNYLDSNVKRPSQDQEVSGDSKREDSREEVPLHIKPKEPEDKVISRNDDLNDKTSSSPKAEQKIQTSATAAIKPEQATTTRPVNETPAVQAEPANQIPVSRGTVEISPDENKYPQLSKNNGIYGQFRYRDSSGGRIEIEPAWIYENIVTITLPGLNREVQVHKEAADNFILAFNYIKNGTAVINGQEVSLLSLIKTMNGTFVSRHVNWNPAKGLSNHSWGTAIDINASDHFRYVNPGQEPNDPNLILWEKAFKPAGFSWGNSYADSMHYELLK